MPVIGFLNSGAQAVVVVNDRLSAFRQGLNEAGFAESRNLAIEFCFANGQRDRIFAHRIRVLPATAVTSIRPLRLSTPHYSWLLDRRAAQTASCILAGRVCGPLKLDVSRTDASART
jgi:hypothetical protein